MGVAYLAYTDITELAGTAAALQESRKLYENAVKSARLVLWEYDIAAHRITFADNDLTRTDCERIGLPPVVENIPDALAAYFEAADMPKIRAMGRVVSRRYILQSDCERHASNSIYSFVLTGVFPPLNGSNRVTAPHAGRRMRQEWLFS